MDIFKLITEQRKEGEGKRRTVSLAIDLKIAGKDISCPVSEIYSSHEKLAAEVKGIQRNLEALLDKAKAFFEGSSSAGGPDFSEDMSAEEIWNALSNIRAEDQFMAVFNGLDDARRKEVAEYVLTRCNIFSGKGAVFSTRYNGTSALME